MIVVVWFFPFGKAMLNVSKTASISDCQIIGVLSVLVVAILLSGNYVVNMLFKYYGN
jgi:hypothetical protein